MPRLDPDATDDFLRRFHRGRDGRLLGVDVSLARGRVAAVAFTLRLRDADDDDAETDLRLELAEVNELRLQVRPTEDPQDLVDGIAVGTFGGLTFVDLMPWTDRPSGVHDYRASNCYAAGAVLRWETIGVVGKARHMRGCFCPCHTHATRGGEESPAWLPTSWSRAPLAILTLRITTALKQQAKTSATGPL